MLRLRLGVVGVGHLGREHARIVASLPEAQLVGVADTNGDQAETVARRLGTCAYHDHRPLLNEVDAAIIAVPTRFHHAVACDFIRRGIPLLIEKPIAHTLEQAEELVELARRHGALLQVGHIERFNPAFEDLLQRPLQPKFVTCQRLGLFSGRSFDIGAVLDLMIHDLDLVLALVQAPVRSVDAVGVSILGGHEDVANARLVFENGCVVVLTANRLSNAPIRQMSVWGPEGYASIDYARRRLTLIQPAEPLRWLRQNLQNLEPAMLASVKNELFGRHLQVLKLHHNAGDQLTNELQDFIRCVQTGSRPRASGEAGRDAVALALRILDRIHAHRWEGESNGPTGPLQLPPPLGPLFRSLQGEVAA
jgi:predicted dehydrogenase